MRPKCKRHAPLREKNAGRHAAAGKFHMCQCSWIIMRMIVRSVSRMPSLASVPMLRIVFSTPLTTMPCIYICIPSSPASTAEAILAAQLAFAPSQIMPEAMATALTTVCAISRN